ncbi:hypothetical protein [Deinococcus aquatilis]|uniref:hypothetical protein n=1 Tax=Deinococcus aquatilis TaxID=519440 RepID=UPI00039DFDCC|nr:hypothetical protein [Deinococcus aquatilis]
MRLTHSNRQALQRFPFDDLSPFRDIFHLEASPQYKAPSILFGGTFKALEQDWPEWFTRFTQLPSSLETIEANVILDCILGRFAWTLALEPLLGSLSVPEDGVPLMGHPW